MGQENRFLKYYEYHDSVVSVTKQLNAAIRLADSTSEDKLWEEYYLYFHKMDAVLPVESGDDLPNYYYAAEHLSDTATAKRLLFRMAEIKWCDSVYLNMLRDVFHLEKRDYWDALSAIVYARPGRNETYIAELNSMSMEDQRLRSMLNSASEDKESLWQHIKSTDSVHIIRLKELINLYGFPTFSRVGFNGNRTASLLAQHGGPDFLSWYVPLARMAADDRDYSIDWLAYMIDRDRTFCGLPQLYGTQLISFGDEKVNYFEPIADIEHLNERRYSVGLGDIRPYYKSYGLDSIIIHPNFYNYSYYYQIQEEISVDLAKGDTASAIRLLTTSNVTVYPFMRDLQRKYDLLIAAGQDSLARACGNMMVRCGYIPPNDTSALTRRFMADYREQLNDDWSRELRASLVSAEAFSEFLRKGYPRYSTEAWEESATLEGIKTIVLSLSEKDAKDFFSLLLQQVTTGNLHPEDYAQLYDIMYNRTHGMTYYGALKDVKIDNRKDVDKRRKEIGLPPLWTTRSISRNDKQNTTE